jgi:hypothetical protein
LQIIKIAFETTGLEFKVKGNSMLDLLIFFGTLIFFVLSWGYVLLAERL